MGYELILEELKLKYPAFAVSRVNEQHVEENHFSCVNKIFDYVKENQKVYICPETIQCKGALAGCGFSDEYPDIPGGFGNFIAKGSGAGFPPGERIKCCPEVAEQMMAHQPKSVMENLNAIRVEIYQPNIPCEYVILLANPDQLSALVTMFYYRTSDYDSIIVPIASGCAQLFRLQFAELKKSSPKAVLSNMDFFSRPLLDADLFTFSIPVTRFREMCEDAGESCLFSPAFQKVKQRLSIR